jgi:hypothetical protein
MASTRKTTWTTYEALAVLHGIDTEDAALSSLRRAGGTLGLVRRTKDGQFAVIELRDGKARLNKVLPSLDRARSYNFACAR